MVNTAVVCPTCSGEGTAPGTHPETCEVCGGRGEVSQVTRSFLGQVMTTRPCPRCGGHGTVIHHPCPECDGDGRVRTRRTIKVPIPAGVEDGTHIQLAGEGEVGPGGGPPGDLFLEIVQRPHPIFERRGDDLHCTLTIPMVAAALGATLSVETLDGKQQVDIRPGSQSGQAIPLYGKGMQHLNDSGRGDLVIHLTVETPTKLDAEQERLLRELARLRGEEAPPGKFAPGSAGILLPAPRRLQRPLGFPRGDGAAGTAQLGTAQLGTAQLGTAHADLGTARLGTAQLRSTAQLGTAQWRRHSGGAHLRRP